MQQMFFCDMQKSASEQDKPKAKRDAKKWLCDYKTTAFEKCRGKSIFFFYLEAKMSRKTVDAQQQQQNILLDFCFVFYLLSKKRARQTGKLSKKRNKCGKKTKTQIYRK